MIGIAGISNCAILEQMVRGDVRTLRSLIDDGRRFEIDHAVHIVIASCKALTRADPRGAISPVRIEISSNGEISLGDPLAPDALREAFGYVAPEMVPPSVESRSLSTDLRTSQRQGVAYPGEVDRPPAAVFSLGCVLWELLAGRPLFRGQTDYLTVQLAAAATIPPLSNVPTQLEAVVRKALAKSIVDRYRNPGELVQALGDYLVIRGRS